VLEELQTSWEKKRDSRKYALYKDALTDGLEKVGKYYSRLNEKPSFVLALSKYSNSVSGPILTLRGKYSIRITNSLILNMHGVGQKNKQPRSPQEIPMRRTGKMRPGR
jgi:hypothetical protein